MWVFIVLILSGIVLVLVFKNDSGNNTVKRRQRPASYEKEVEKRTSLPRKINIDTYHESNKIIGSIQQEYIRKYHEYEGPVYYVDPSEMDNYLMRFSVALWNSELDVDKIVVGATLENLISQCETQFKIWADKLNKKNSPEGIKKRLQANRKYLSTNKLKLRELDTAATHKQHDALLRKMQLRYNEIVASGNTLKTDQLQELQELGLNTEAIDCSKLGIPDMTFEVKGLYYRSAQAQLEATLLEVGDNLLLEEDPDNEADASAVKVLTLSGEFIGYVDKEHCVSVGALINLIDSCTVIKKTNHQIPYITAKVSFKE